MKHLLEGDEPKVVMGTVQHDDKGSKIIASRILTLEEAQARNIEALHIHLRAERLDRDGLARLRHLLVTYPGECKTLLHLTVDGEAEAIIALNPKLKVNPSRTFLLEMEQRFGQNCVAPVYKACSH
jgi:DNA polymerase-3 subunit alpha